MGEILQRFKTRPNYLIGYFSVSLLIFAGLVSLELKSTVLQGLLTQPISPWGFLLLPLGLILAIQIPVLAHNCVHGNLRHKFLNIVCGEIAGVYTLLGFEAFGLNHIFHHAFSDTDLDPHNPTGKPFYKFFFANNLGGTEPVLRKYLEYHGDTLLNRNKFKWIVFLHFANVPIRLAFWFFLLGPSLFLTFFIPSYLFHMFVFAHINFITHETLSDGSVRLHNLDSNYYYKFVNFFGSGVYFHKNHHLNTAYYNPQSGPSHSWFVR